MAINSVSFADLNRSGSPAQEETGEVCIANISPLERRKRLQFAVRQLVITLMILGGMILLQFDPLWRLLLQFLFSAATVSYFQARDKTWVTLAARGARKFGPEEEQIEEEAERQQVRRQARRVIVKGFILALPLTLLSYLLPL